MSFGERNFILDMDGTLYTMTSEYVNYQREFEKLALMRELSLDSSSVNFYWDYYRNILEDRLGRIPSAREIILQFDGIDLEWLNKIRGNLDPSPYITTDPNLIKLLNTSNNLRFVILSTSPSQLIEKFRVILKLQSKNLVGVIGIDNVSLSKPNPEGFQKAAQFLGVSYDSIWSFGDRYDFDIVPAIGLGMNGCLVQGPTDLFNKIVQI